jgi:hypothetical protein
VAKEAIYDRNGRSMLHTYFIDAQNQDDLRAVGVDKVCGLEI